MKDDLLPSAPVDPRWAEIWQQLGHGAPTLSALAQVCSFSLVSGGDQSIVLSPEARTILYAAKDSALVEIKGSNRAFDAPGRMLAVYVETTPGQTLIFRNRENPAATIRFLAGFRELCAAGYMMHHIYQEFSLTRAGLDLAQTIPLGEVQNYLKLATDSGQYE